MGRNAVHWYLQRISGAALLILIAAHFWVEHFMTAPAREGKLTYEIVVSRVANPVWQAVNISFLLIALYHGLAGLRSILLDYGPWQKRGVAAIDAVLVAVGIVWAWWGIAAFRNL